MPKTYSSSFVAKVLLQNGFRLAGQRGSHAKFRKDGFTVIVPMGRKDLKPGTFRSIVVQAGLTEDSFRENKGRAA